MSPAAVTQIVRELESAGLVHTIGTGRSRGGRRPVMLGVRDNAFVIIGVDLGARHIAVALSTLRGELHGYAKSSFPVRDDPAGALREISQLIERASREAGISDQRLVGIGVATPSPVDPQRPGHLSPRVIPAWRDVDLAGELRRRYGTFVAIDNDANLGALAEQWWGAGVSQPGSSDTSQSEQPGESPDSSELEGEADPLGENLIYIKIGMGVGSGYIMDGELYRGTSGHAGEIGHVVVDPRGEPCMCGQRGCLVNMIGSDAVLSRARRELEFSRPGARRGPITVTDVVERARRDDTAARAIIDDIAMYLSSAITGLINLLDPGIVVLGGEIVGAGPMLIEPIQAALRRNTLAPSLARVWVVASTLGERSIALGAATLILASALREPDLFTSAVDNAARVCSSAA